MDVRVLGPVEVCVEGRPVLVGAGKPRALLALLALNTGSTVSAERLIDGLWGERPPATAAKMVQVYVSQLRKALAAGGDGAEIVTRGRGYELRLASGDVDVRRFERLVARGAPREALALWRGRALEDVADEPFAAAEIRRLEELRLAALELAIDHDLAGGRHREVIGELEALVAEEPLRERLHAQRMLALYRSGRQSDALEAYREARALLVEEIGVEPGPELRRLHQAILVQDAALELPGRAQQARAGTRAVKAGVFVGRERELAALCSALGDALEGNGRLVLLAGEPGIGKTGLAAEFARKAEERGARVRWGRCWEAGGAPPYWPWVQLIRSHARECEPGALRAQLGRGAAELAHMLPELRELFPDLPEPATLEREDAGARFRLFDATTGFLRTVAQAWPLVLVLDDLHAADAPSLLLLRFLARELSEARILVVAAYRDRELPPDDPVATGLAELARGAYLHLVLGGLTRMDIAGFIAKTTASKPAEPLVAAIREATDGNPLFVTEMVRLLDAEGRLEEAGRDGRSLGLPHGVRGAIASRLRRLSGGCREVLSLASVLGREFAVDDVASLSGLERAKLLAHLDEAASARVLSVVPGAVGRLRFSHALVRDTLYDELPPARRAGLHQRAAAVLEALPDTRTAELAHHFLRALPEAPLDKALDHACRAADEALSLLAYEEAARLYETALTALTLSRGTREPMRCELLLAVGGAQIRGGDGARAKQTFLAAAALARRLELPEKLARAALGYGGRFVWARAGSDERLVPLLEEALAASGEQDSALRARLCTRLAAALRDQPARQPRAELSRQGVAIARRTGDRAALAYALAGCYAAVWWAENAKERLALADELIALAETIDDRERAVEGHGYRMHALLELGELEAARAELAIRGRLTNEMRQPAQLWIQLVLEGMWSLFLGRLEEAEAKICAAGEHGHRAQSEDAHAMHQLQLFALRREQARLEEIEDSLVHCARANPSRPVFRCALAILHCELDHEPEARDLFAALTVDEFASLPRDGDWLFEMTLLAEVCDFLADAERAASLYRRLLPYAGSTVFGLSAEITTGVTARYLGILASATGRFERAARHFEQALAVNTRSGARPSVAHTQHDYARMLLARNAPGDRDRAGELLSDCLATSSDLGMAALTARVSALRNG
jgi:DNA-binding SARP family transcriptional activator